jgi:DNA-binding CsgD family transcriptional regulator
VSASQYTIPAAVDAIQTLRGSAREFWRVFDRSPVPMVTVDNEKRYHAANAAARLTFRLSEEEWLERRIEDLTPQHMLPILDERWAYLLEHGSVTGDYDCDLPDGPVTINYCAVTNLLPGEHLIVFLPSSLPQDELVELIDADEPQPDVAITRRERDVLKLIASGASSELIAEELSISVETVRTHVRNLLQKLGARNRAHAIALAMQQSLVGAP